MIPTGFVTFLFTDIEGSTKLAQEYPESLHAALAEHDLILNDECVKNNGFVFKKIGDAFCVAFENAQDAVRSAFASQIRIAAENPGGVNLKIRMGIHSGNAQWDGSDYSGYVTLARIQRIMSTAYGEQIIISNDTYELVKHYFHSCDSKQDDTPLINFRDLGERRLKDLIQPIKLYQIVSKELREDFPPLKTLDSRPNNLPAQLNSFIGREKEIREIKSQLSETSLLTLVGPGGTGKTRLALQIGADIIDNFSNGVWFVELAAISNPSFISGMIASVFNLKTSGNQDIFEIIKNYLRDKELLLIIDNCEHLIEECSKLSHELLSNCKKLKILTSSREAMGIPGEVVYSVPSMTLPDISSNYSTGELSQYESVRLFIDRALFVKPDFKVTNANSPALAQLCFELDGIPLAIELAAARIKVLSVEKILDRLKDRFNLLTGGKRTVLPRQQTLKALIDWSYDLLSDKEKILLHRLSVFTGGCSFEAAENICSDDNIDDYEILDLLSNLINKSLVKMHEMESESRYIMLETIRQYSENKLIESNEQETIHKKKFEYFYNLVKDSESELSGIGQKNCIKKINSEYENIRQCIRWAEKNNPSEGLKICAALGKYWELHSHFTEAVESISKCLVKSDDAGLLIKTKALYWKGFFLVNQGNYGEAKKILHECIAVYEKLNYKEGTALIYSTLGSLALFEADYKSVNLFSNKSLELSEEINNKSYVAKNLQNIGLKCMQTGDYDGARRKFEDGLKIYRELNDSVQLAKLIGNIGALEYLQVHYDEARKAFEESLDIRHELGDKQGIGIALANIGAVAFMQKDYENARRALQESIEITRELGDRRIYVTPVSTLGSLAYETNNFPEAAFNFREAVKVAYEIGDKYTIAKCIEGFSDILIRLGKFDQAAMLAAKYVNLLELSQKNLIEGEYTKIEQMKSALLTNMDKHEFEKCWSGGNEMTTEDAIEFIMSVKITPIED